MPITPVADLVAAAKARITSLTPAVARARVQAGAACLVDIRDVRELDRTGRIPGAIHAPRGMLEFWVDPASRYHRPVLSERPLILFCAASERSALAVATLQDMGLTNVAEIEGGFTAWAAAGNSVDGPAQAP